MKNMLRGTHIHMPHRKLFYVPGLISLVGLPILFLIFSPNDPKSEVVLKLYIPTDDENPPNGGIANFSRYSVNQSIRGKNLISIYLTDKRMFYGDFRDDEFTAKLNFVTREMERLQFTNDTNTVLRVVFDESCEYDDFIHVLNSAIIYDFKKYALIRDSFYFLPNPPPIYYPLGEIKAMQLVVDVVPDIRKPTDWEVFKRRTQYLFEEWKYEFKENYLLVAGFIALILLPGLLGIRKIRK